MKGNLLAVPTLAVAVLAVPVLALILVTAAPASPEAGSTRFSPEALLAADAPWTSVQAVAGTSFWPEPPAFDSIVDEEDPQPLTAVSQSYDKLGGSAKITTRLYAFASREISVEFLQSNAIVVELGNYELRFVAGRHVADVFCWAPFVAKASPSCEQAARTLAEHWYAQLERSSG